MRHWLRLQSRVAAAGPTGCCTIAVVMGLFGCAGARAIEIDTFYCAGNQPLWEMEIEAGQGRFGTLLDGKRVLVGGAEPTPDGRPGWRGRTRDGVELLVRFETVSCSSPLLRRPAEHRATLVLNGGMPLSGCCHLLPRDAMVVAGVPVTASGAPALEASRGRIRAEPGRVVNVRAQPRIASDNVVAQLPGGARIDLAGREVRDGDLWYRVRLTGNPGDGWIRSDLVEPATGPDDPAVAQWNMHPELMPAIDRCLSEISARPALVTRAHVDAEGAVAVRVMDAEGQRWACTGDKSGATVRELSRVLADDRLPGEFRPLFLRAPDEPTRDPCYRHEPVRDTAGQIMGWLSFGLCS
jgi:hypothetical protein